MLNHIKILRGMYRQMMDILNTRQKRQCVGVFAVILLTAVFSMFGISVVIPFIYAIMSPEMLIGNKTVQMFMNMFGIETSYGLLIMIAMGIILIYVVKNLLLVYYSYVQISFRCRLQKDLSVLMLKTYLKRPYTYFINVNSSEILRGIGTDITGVFFLLDSFFVIMSDGLTLLLIAAFVIYTDPLMALGILAIAALCLLLITFGFKRMMKTAGENFRMASALKDKCAYQSVNGIKEIIVMQRQDKFIDKYEKAYEITKNCDVDKCFIAAIPGYITEGVFVSGIIAIVCFRLGSGIEAASFVPQLAAMALAATRILPSISKLSTAMTQLVFYRPTLEAAHENIVQAREYEKQMKKYADDRGINAKDVKLDSFEDKLAISKITWQYENTDRKVLKDLSLTIHKGESVALIGESGAGKTTLADVVLGLLKPQKGTVAVDGYDIYAIPEKWSRIIGYVPQAVYLLDDSIRNNIAFGINPDDIDDALIWQAIKKAQLKSFVDALPDGLDTFVGERGVKLSGGQRQRIAIARALYYNPDILVLDEATSALDNETETAVMESIDALQGQVTLIIVAHRLTTIRNCDKIYEIKSGEAVERNKKEVLSGIQS